MYLTAVNVRGARPVTCCWPALGSSADGGGSRPLSVTVMAEYFDGPVWDRPDGSGEPLYDLTRLGVPAELIERLQAWNSRFEALAVTDFTSESPEVEADWHRHAWDLAVALQDALPAVEVW